VFLTVVMMPPPGQELVEHHLPDVERRLVELADPVPAGVSAEQDLLDQVFGCRSLAGEDRGESQDGGQLRLRELLERHPGSW
jgi:hypothetical protein